MRTIHARKIREGIRIGRLIVDTANRYGHISQYVSALYGHPSLRDPLTEQAKYRTLVHMWSNQ